MTAINDNKIQDFFQGFTEEIRPRLPWAQIINPPSGLTLKQMSEFKVNHGFFVNEDNIALSGINLQEIEQLGWRQTSQEFQGGKEIVKGYVTDTIKFCLLGRTETIVESDGVFVGPLFTKGSNTLSEAGIASRDNPKDFRRKSWWLIMLLNEFNDFINTVPIKLALSGATGAALTQELIKQTEETEVGFFKASGQVPQSLSDLAKKMFVFNWTLGYCKPGTLAAYEYVAERTGLVSEQLVINRYSSALITRSVKITPVESIEQSIFSPKSPKGQKLIELSDNFIPSFLDGFYRRIGETTVPDGDHSQPVEQEQEVKETVNLPHLLNTASASLSDDLMF